MSRDTPPAEVHFLKGEEYLEQAEELMENGSWQAGATLATLATAHFAAASADRDAVTAGFARDIHNAVQEYAPRSSRH